MGLCHGPGLVDVAVTGFLRYVSCSLVAMLYVLCVQFRMICFLCMVF